MPDFLRARGFPQVPGESRAFPLRYHLKESADSRVYPWQPWGTNYGGASYKFTVLDTNGVRRAQQGMCGISRLNATRPSLTHALARSLVRPWIAVGQMAQTAYHSLHTPYSYFGLGRTNNYVESLFIGSTRRLAREHVLAVEGIIPNSQVVINPWQADPSAWTKQLYLHPGDWIPWVTVVLITTIVGLAAVVVVLHVNERVSAQIRAMQSMARLVLTTRLTGVGCAERRRA